MDAFVSHSSAQVAIAKRIERALKGLDVWLDASDIHAGRLLRDQLTDAIRDAKTFVLVWSKEAAKSRWVCAELLTAFHFDRPIIPCSSGEPALPQFMSNLLWIDPGAKKWTTALIRAVKEAPPHAFAPIVMTGQEPALKEAANSLALDQHLVAMAFAARDLATARKQQQVVERALVPARRKWPYDAQLLNIAGYHAKNAYMLKHWDRIQGGQTPADPLLQRADRMFFQSLFVDPFDVGALNGLASILMLEHELYAARFFNARAIELAEREGIRYDAALYDRNTIEYYIKLSEKLNVGR
jgi:hypothetical protein